MIFLSLGFLLSRSLAEDIYTENVAEYPLISPEFRLVEFNFTISADRNESHLLSIFPQTFASLLAPFHTDLQSVEGSLVRGRWKERVWGASPIRLHPFGSSMQVKAANGVSNVMWTKASWMFASVLGASFQSLDLELKSFHWITPLDVGPNVRVASNPNENVCTENLERFVELLPCRHRKGLGESILRLSQGLARTEFLQIFLRASSGYNLTGSVWAILDSQISESIKEKFTLCPAVSSPGGSPSRQVAVQQQIISVKRSLIGTARRPERTAGKLIFSISNFDRKNISHFVEYFDQLPFFLVPLWSTLSVRSSVRGEFQYIPSITYSDGIKSPTYFSYLFSLAPNETLTVSLDVYKKYVPVSALSYSFEKGFDIASAAYRVDKDDSEIFFTRGLVVVVPLPDQTNTFNAIAITLTAIAVFHGIVYRNFSGKRRDLVSQEAAAVAAREPPIVRILRFIFSRIKSAFSR